MNNKQTVWHIRKKTFQFVQSLTIYPAPHIISTERFWNRHPSYARTNDSPCADGSTGAIRIYGEIIMKPYKTMEDYEAS